MSKKRKSLPRQTREEVKRGVEKLVQSRSAALLAEMQQNATEQVVWRYGAVLCMVLHDKFGFGGKRLRIVLGELTELFDSVNGDWCSFDDVANTLLEETGIDMRTLEAAKNIK